MILCQKDTARFAPPKKSTCYSSHPLIMSILMQLDAFT